MVFIFRRSARRSLAKRGKVGSGGDDAFLRRFAHKTAVTPDEWNAIPAMQTETAVYAEFSTRLADRIRSARLAAKMSRAHLARRIGVVASAAVQWELPKGTSPRLRHLVAIAEVTGVSFEWLATGRGLMAFIDQAATASGQPARAHGGANRP
jgi:DNA-binding transcriptional regulator YiaG